MKQCAFCGAELDIDDKFCPSCGEMVVRKMIQCSACKSYVDPKVKKCNNCGARIRRITFSKGIIKLSIHHTWFYIITSVIIILFFVVVAVISIFGKSEKKGEGKRENPFRITEDNINANAYFASLGSGETNVFVYDEIAIEIPKKWGDPFYDAPYVYFYPENDALDGMIMIFSYNPSGDKLDISEVESDVAEGKTLYSRIAKSKYERKGSIIDTFYILDYKSEVAGVFCKQKAIVFEYNRYDYSICYLVEFSRDDSLFDTYIDIIDSIKPVR